MIKNWVSDSVNNGFALGQTGMRDGKIRCNSVSGEIKTDSPKVKAITNYNRWLAQEVLRRNANQQFIEENGPIGPDCFGGSNYP